MKYLQYQQDAINDLTQKAIRLLNLRDNDNGQRRNIVFEAPTGSGKTVMALQALANIVDELKDRGDCIYKEVAFIWFAPRKLHLQSYKSVLNFFKDTRKLKPVMYNELDSSVGIQPGEVLFVNWESLNKKNSVIVRENENSNSLYEITRKTQEEAGLPIIAIIDEEHMFWSKTADKSAKVLENINPKIEIRISATPRTVKPTEKVTVYRSDVIKAEMIKKEIILNPEIEEAFKDERTLNDNLLRAALNKRKQIADAYSELGVKINPLLLIQLPNDNSENMTADDIAIAEQVKTLLNELYGINTESGQLAIWLANEKENLANLEKPDNIAKVLLFKEAIALGWDCPRAAVLLIFRKLQSAQFTVQTVGRIMRMPEQKHYSKELLNVGYVYTDIAKEYIHIITADANYIMKDTITAKRREKLKNVSLPSYYSSRPNVERNYLGPDFKKTLYEEAIKQWNLDEGTGKYPSPMLFSLEELAAMLDDADESGTLPRSDDKVVNMNRSRAQRFIKLNVKNINAEIPNNLHFQDEIQTLVNNDQFHYARKASEIDQAYMAYISEKGNQFESKGRTDKIASYLLEIMYDLFGIPDWDAKKVILYHSNKPKFDHLLDNALKVYAKKRESAKAEHLASRKLTEYQWEVPEERVYDGQTNEEEEMKIHAMEPFVRLNNASNPERNFTKYLEKNLKWIDWWYKNGDEGKQHYAIPYEGNKLFYVDFVIRMKNGNIYLFDTKTEGSDINAPLKHNALLKYIKDHKKEELKLCGGGIIIQEGENWLYSPLPIENTTDTTNWNCFNPQNA